MLTLSVSFVLPAFPQTPAPKPPPSSSQNFFSGTITALTGESITVNRRGLGKDSVTRTFVLDSATTIEGRLRLKSKVTVRFLPGANGDRAVHIIVR